ncbi:membrane protein [Gordonia phage Camerico]|nr:membrane protein [Gordonia phage Camerico]
MPYTKLHRDARNPFEYALIAFSLAYSFFQLVADVYPGAIYTFTGDGYRFIWAGIYLAASLASAVGIFLRNHSQGLALECWGMLMMGGCILVYAAALISTGKDSAYYAAGFFATFGFAAMARAIIIWLGLRRIARGDFIKPGDLGE